MPSDDFFQPSSSDADYTEQLDERLYSLVFRSYDYQVYVSTQRSKETMNEEMLVAWTMKN